MILLTLLCLLFTFSHLVSNSRRYSLYTKLRDVIETAETKFRPSDSNISKNRNHIRKYVSMSIMVRLAFKKLGLNISWHCPFKLNVKDLVKASWLRVITWLKCESYCNMRLLAHLLYKCTSAMPRAASKRFQFWRRRQCVAPLGVITLCLSVGLDAKWTNWPKNVAAGHSTLCPGCAAQSSGSRCGHGQTGPTSLTAPMPYTSTMAHTGC